MSDWLSSVVGLAPLQQCPLQLLPAGQPMHLTPFFLARIIYAIAPTNIATTIAITIIVVHIILAPYACVGDASMRALDFL